MKNIKYIVLVLLSTLLANNLNSAVDNQEVVEINIIEQNKNYVIINYKINAYDIADIEYDNNIYQSVVIDGEPNFLIENAPSLRGKSVPRTATFHQRR